MEEGKTKNFIFFKKSTCNELGGCDILIKSPLKRARTAYEADKALRGLQEEAFVL